MGRILAISFFDRVSNARQAVKHGENNCKAVVTGVSCSVEENVRSSYSGGPAWQIEYLTKTQFCNGSMKFDTGYMPFETEDTAVSNLCALIKNDFCPSSAINPYPIERALVTSNCYGL